MFRLIALVLILAAPAFAQKPVKLMTVNEADAGVTRQFFGQVVARQTVDLAFQVGGQIVEFPVIEGQTIPEGDLIARLDLETFELALDQARLQKDQADRTVARFEQLSGNTVSQVTIDDAITQAGLAEIAVRNAEYSLDHATLHAPFDALVATRDVANFTTIAAGTPVVRLHDMSELRIEIDVPEILFQRAGEDPDVEVFATFPTSPQQIPLEVREFNAETSAVGQTFRLTFALSPPEEIRVLPGSSATVSATLKMGLGGIDVPSTALKTATDGAVSVLVYEPAGAAEGTLSNRAVTVVPGPDGGFIVTDGLANGEEIVAAGVNALEDGQAVRRFTGYGE